jgi:hypothetical protein
LTSRPRKRTLTIRNFSIFHSPSKNK